MPCVLKERTEKSPGIITLTNNEAVYGPAATSPRIRNLLAKTTENGSWLFGVHIQGDCSKSPWPLADWQSFILWPDPEAPFLSGVPRERRLGLNCINFMPDPEARPVEIERRYDLCIISRASSIKRILETMRILRRLFDARPNLRVNLIVPDHRSFTRGDRTYQEMGLEREFFDLPLRLFSCREMEQISFLCSSTESFGLFPLSNELMTDILRSSKFLLLPSHAEGTPRVIAEALLNGTVCIVSKSLRCGILDSLTQSNSVAIDDDDEGATAGILAAFDRFDAFHVDLEAARARFLSERHKPELKSYLSLLITARGKPVEGAWALDSLHLRLACHGQKRNGQIMHSEKFFETWLDRAERIDPYDEDALLSGMAELDRPPGALSNLVSSGRRALGRLLRSGA